MIRSTTLLLCALLLPLSFQGQVVFATQPTQNLPVDEAVANMKAAVENLEEDVRFLEELEELDLLDLLLEFMPEGKKSNLVLLIESLETVEGGIDDLPPYARAKIGEELIDRIRTVIADYRRLFPLPVRDSN